MRELSRRERVLAIIVALVCILGGGIWLKKSSRTTLYRYQSELETVEREIAEFSRRTDPMLEPKQEKTTILLLDQLLSSQSMKELQVVQMDRTAENSFRLVTEGPFLDFMRLFTTLEKEEGSFVIELAQLERVGESAETIHQGKGIRGTFHLNKRAKE